MRDPARIPAILEALRVEWEKMPQQRLGQLIINALSQEWLAPERMVNQLEDEALVAHVQSFCRPKKTGQ